MIYEPDPREEKKKKRRFKSKRGRGIRPLLRFALCLLVFFVCLSLCANFLFRVYAGSDGWVHVLLLGMDDEDSSSRTDAMLLASCSTDGRVKLISLQRDVMLTMGEYGRHKLNAAYKQGGAELLKQCIDYLWKIRVDYVATVNYSSFQHLVDAAGGITLSVTQEEAREINKNMRSRRGGIRDYSPLEELQTYGEGIRLTGEQALGYCRIRRIDSDYMRTSRQRMALSALLDALLKNPLRLVSFGIEAFSAVETDIPPLAAVSLGFRAVTGGGAIQTYRLPADGTFDSDTQNGVWSIHPYLEDNRDMMRRILAE